MQCDARSSWEGRECRQRSRRGTWLVATDELRATLAGRSTRPQLDDDPGEQRLNYLDTVGFSDDRLKSVPIFVP